MRFVIISFALCVPRMTKINRFAASSLNNTYAGRNICGAKSLNRMSSRDTPPCLATVFKSGARRSDFEYRSAVLISRSFPSQSSSRVADPIARNRPSASGAILVPRLATSLAISPAMSRCDSIRSAKM